MDKDTKGPLCQTDRKQLLMRVSALTLASGFVFSGTGEFMRAVNSTEYLMANKPATEETLNAGLSDLKAAPLALAQELAQIDEFDESALLPVVQPKNDELNIDEEHQKIIKEVFSLLQKAISILEENGIISFDGSDSQQTNSATTRNNAENNSSTQETEIVPPTAATPKTTEAATKPPKATTPPATAAPTTEVFIENPTDAPAQEEEQTAFTPAAGYPLSVATISQKTVPADLLFDENGVPLNYTKVITGKGTAYSGDPITATGTKPIPGSVAVNPKIIPYGSKLWIVSNDGKYVYGYSVAEDTGGFIYWKNAPIVDLFMNTNSQCSAFGVRNVTIYVLPN